MPKLPWPLPCDPGSVPGQYGSLDVRNKTVEEVYVEMLKPKDGVRLKVQYRPEDFSKVKGLPGDSFYIRCRCRASRGSGPGEGLSMETVPGKCFCFHPKGWDPDH